MWPWQAPELAAGSGSVFQHLRAFSSNNISLPGQHLQAPRSNKRLFLLRATRKSRGCRGFTNLSRAGQSSLSSVPPERGSRRLREPGQNRSGAQRWRLMPGAAGKALGKRRGRLGKGCSEPGQSCCPFSSPGALGMPHKTPERAGVRGWKGLPELRVQHRGHGH